MSDSSASKKYQKLDQREHVLRRPDMYIGSVKADNVTAFIVENSTKMVKTDV